MNHTLYYGVFAKNYEDAFFDFVHKAQAPLDPLVVLVPNPFLGLYLKRKLANKTRGHSGIHFLTFDDVLKQNTTLKIVPKELEEIFVYEKLKPFKFDCFSLTMDWVSLITEAYNHWLAELKPKFIETSQQAKELEKIFQTLDQCQTDPALKAFSDFECSQRTVGVEPSSESVYVYGFQTLSSLQQQILNQISQTYSLHYFLPLSNSPKLNDYKENNFFKLFSVAKKIEPEPFAVQPKTIQCPTPFVEHQTAMRLFLKKVSQSSSELNESAFLFPSHQKAQSFVKTLQRAHVPYYYSNENKLLASAPAKAALHLFSMLNQDYFLSDVCAFFKKAQLKSSFFKDPSLAQDWELIFKKAQMVYLNSSELEKLKKYTSKDSKEENLKNSLIPFLEGLLIDIKSLEEALVSFKAFSESLYIFFEKYVFQDVFLSKLLESFDTLGFYDRFFKNNTFSLQQYRSVFEKKTQTIHVHDQKFEKSGAFVGTFSQAHFMFFSDVYIFDLNAGLFPKQNKDPLLTKGSFLNHEKIKERTVTDFENQKELFDFLQASSLQNLTLLFSTHDENGKNLNPSSFIYDFSFQDIPLYPWEQTLETYIDELDWTQVNGFKLSHLEPQNPFLLNFAPLTKSHDDFVLGRLSSDFFSDFDGSSLTPQTSAVVRFSAGQIETFFECPYRYHLEYNLRLKTPLAVDDLSLRPIDKGSWVHGVLYEFFMHLRDKGELPLKKENENKLHLTLDKIFSEHAKKIELSIPIYNRSLFEFEKKMILSDLHELIHQELLEQSTLPLAFEVRFGMEQKDNAPDDPKYSTHKPLVLKHENKTYEIYGKIDRINQSGSSFEVIDYKTGKLKNEKNNDFSKGLSLQLPLYILATEQLFSAKERVSSKMLSLHAYIKPVYFLSEQLHKKMDQFFLFLKTFSAFKSTGFFPPYPGKHMENCRYCDFKPICSPHIQNIYNKKQFDPKIKPFLDTKEGAR